MNIYPKIIQGGMGAGVSSWRLANAVSSAGQLGVVSGTALDAILARRLQDGDPGGHMRRGLDNFPFPKMAEKIWQNYFIPSGKPKLASYKTLPLHTLLGPRELRELSIVANFVEVFLAREGHGNPVGINFLEKIQLPLLPCIYGAMLAGVDYVLVGAGVPLKIPGVLDQFTNHESATYPLDIVDLKDGGKSTISFAPRDYMECELPPLRRPKFLAIIASNTLATTLVKKANGCVDGFIIEGPTAGGHNAPPRGKLQLSPLGEPIYGERDIVDLTKLLALNLPFWLAGGFASPEKLRDALAAGAAGIQVGTAFAFCAESSLCDDYKHALLNMAVSGKARVITDPIASPTNFPFKVALLEGTLSDEDIYSARPRICDLGFLREAYRTVDGSIDFRCPAEPVSIYLSKGGKLEDTQGRKCLCNALVANIGLPQVRSGKYVESALITSGDALAEISRFLPAQASTYSAADVLSHLLNG